MGSDGCFIQFSNISTLFLFKHHKYRWKKINVEPFPIIVFCLRRGLFLFPDFYWIILRVNLFCLRQKSSSFKINHQWWVWLKEREPSLWRPLLIACRLEIAPPNCLAAPLARSEKYSNQIYVIRVDRLWFDNFEGRFIMTTVRRNSKYRWFLCKFGFEFFIIRPVFPVNHDNIIARFWHFMQISQQDAVDRRWWWAGGWITFVTNTNLD